MAALDQLLKALVFARWPLGQRQPFLGETLALWPTCNPGAAGGAGSQQPGVVFLARWVMVGVLVLLVWRAGGSPPRVRRARVLVLAGAVGNLLDQAVSGCRLEGGSLRGVRDFVDLWLQPLLGIDVHLPTFNPADVLILLGLGLWLSAWFQPEEEGRSGGERGLRAG